MYWQRLPLDALKPKWVLDGFPKAGLHLLEQMLCPVAKPQPADAVCRDHWVGTFNGNAWTNEWLPLRTTTFRLARLTSGYYLKGHLGWREDLEQFLYLSGAAVVFVYRDPRDVAVSQAHHILNPDDYHYQHPNKDVYRDLKTFDAALAAVIGGVGPYPGVMERWALYAPWLDVEWALKLPFETMRQEPLESARMLLEYGLRRVTASIGIEIRLDPEEYEATAAKMAEVSQQTERSPNFRRGQVGGWRAVFTDEHVAAFRAHDVEGWVERLGYDW